MTKTFVQQINLNIDDCAAELLQDGAEFRIRYAVTDADREWFATREKNRTDTGNYPALSALAKLADADLDPRWHRGRIAGKGEGYKKIHATDAYAVETTAKYAARYQSYLDSLDPITATESPAIAAIDANAAA
jgi:hypothetical protein